MLETGLGCIPLPANEQEKRQIQETSVLPSNYTFEVPKTIWKIRSTGAKQVALQFPEGLLMYSCVIADLLERHTDCTTVIMGDVTYGACCVDDFTAQALGCDFLVHYGHSCLVPIQDTSGIAMLYVFVNISVHVGHIVDCLRTNFGSDTNSKMSDARKLALVSTVQFLQSLQMVRHEINNSQDFDGLVVEVPQCKPLSPGEILGCTSPRIDVQSVDAIVYVGDGRFHLESVMLHNPQLPAFSYDPYARRLTRENYDHVAMRKARTDAISTAKMSSCFALVLGTLGRQGNPKVFDVLERQLVNCQKKFVRVLLSEISPQKCAAFGDQVDCWVQVACPRLSIDWGSQFHRPMLYPFELAVALEQTTLPAEYWPMDYYSNDAHGPWANNHEMHRKEQLAQRNRKKRPHIVVGGKPA